MNKSQQIAVMQIRAKKKVEELLKRHNAAWHGQDPEIVEKGLEPKNKEKPEREE